MWQFLMPLPATAFVVTGRTTNCDCSFPTPRYCTPATSWTLSPTGYLVPNGFFEVKKQPTKMYINQSQFTQKLQQDCPESKDNLLERAQQHTCVRMCFPTIAKSTTSIGVIQLWSTTHARWAWNQLKGKHHINMVQYHHCTVWLFVHCSCYL